MKRSGFTLLELAISASLAAIMLTASTTILVRGLVASQRMEARLQTTFALEKSMEGLGRELRNAVASNDLRFTGKGDELTFATAEGPTRLDRIHYKLVASDSAKSLVRESQPFPSGEQPVQGKTLVKQIVRFSVVYAMITELDGKPSVQWIQAWEEKPPQQAGLPRLVKVQLESLDSKGRPCSVTREFLIPHGVLRNLSVES